MLMSIKRRKCMFQDNFSMFILFGSLISLLVFPPSFAEAATDAALHFLGNKNIAPVVYLDNNSVPSGVAVDIVRALAKHMSQPIEIRAMDWSEAQALVARGEADALIQINSTEERKKIYDFSDTLLESQFSIFTTTNRVDISGISSLRGLHVGVESGGLPQQLLEKNPLIQLSIIPNFLAGFKMLNEGAIDAVVVDYRVGSYTLAINKMQNIRVTGEPVAFSYSSFAVKIGNTKLLAEINNALQTIKADGTYRNILEKWEPKEVVFQTREQLTHLQHIATIIVLLLLFLIVVIWMVTLKKELAQRKIVEEKLHRLNRELRAISNCNQVLVRSRSEQNLLNDICRIICDEAGYRMAWVGFAENDEAKTIRPVAWAGVEDGYLEKALLTWADMERGNGPGGIAIRSKNSACIQDFATDPKAVPWRDMALQRGYRSCIAFPLIDENGNAFGVLIIYSSESNTFTAEETGLMGEVSDDLAFGIMSLRARSELEQAEEALREANENLENKVAIRTQELDNANESLTAQNEEMTAMNEDIDALNKHLAGMNEELFLANQELSAVNEEFIAMNEELNSTNDKLRDSNNELGNANAELKNAQAQIIQQEKMASIGQLAAGVAHEINNPMGFIIANLDSMKKYSDRISQYIAAKEEIIRQLIQSDGNNSKASLLLDNMNATKKASKIEYILQDTGDLLKETMDGAIRVKNIVKDLKGFVRSDAEDSLANINEGIESTINIIWNEIKYKAKLIKDFNEVPLVKCNLGQLNQVFMNILINAAQAIDTQGEIRVKTWANSDNVFVSIADTGSGIPAEIINRIFEPFFTTKDVGKGTGLGLSVSYDIIKKHDGDLTVVSEPGKGTTFTIKLPAK